MLGINKVVFHVFLIHPNVWGIIKAKPISQLYTGCVIAQSCLTLCHPWTVAHQVTLSMGFSRQEYWRRLLFSSPGDLPDLGIEPSSPALADVFFTTVPPISQRKHMQSWDGLGWVFIRIYQHLHAWNVDFNSPPKKHHSLLRIRELSPDTVKPDVFATLTIDLTALLTFLKVRNNILTF